MGLCSFSRMMGGIWIILKVDYGCQPQLVLRGGDIEQTLMGRVSASLCKKERVEWNTIFFS